MAGSCRRRWGRWILIAAWGREGGMVSFGGVIGSDGEVQCMRGVGAVVRLEGVC